MEVLVHSGKTYKESFKTIGQESSESGEEGGGYKKSITLTHSKKRKKKI